jgi:23S rRNA (cytosine1962-C5)-methyltransferase
MWLSDRWEEFELIDCSRGEKLERWGKYILVRPDPPGHLGHAPDRPEMEVPRRPLRPVRLRRGKWDRNDLPQSWQVRYGS